MLCMTITLKEAQGLSESKSGINLDITPGLTADIAALLGMLEFWQ